MLRGLRGLRSIRSYHSQTGVYGYNAPLHQKLKEAKPDLNLEIEARKANPNLYRYVEAFRLHGHKAAHTNPTKNPSKSLPVLEPGRYGLPDQVDTTGILYGAPQPSMSLNELTDYLKNVYCNNIAIDMLTVEVNLIFLSTMKSSYFFLKCKSTSSFLE